MEVPHIQFIAGSWWTFQLATVTGTRLSGFVGLAAVKVFFAVSPFFSRLSGSSRSRAPVFGALDDEEFFVVEGSCTIRP